MTLVLSAFFTALVTSSKSVKRKQYTSIWVRDRRGRGARQAFLGLLQHSQSVPDPFPTPPSFRFFG